MNDTQERSQSGVYVFDKQTVANQSTAALSNLEQELRFMMSGNEQGQKDLLAWTAAYYAQLTAWLEAASGLVPAEWGESPFGRGRERIVCTDVSDPRAGLSADAINLAMLHPHPYVVEAAGLNHPYTSVDQILHIWAMDNSTPGAREAIESRQVALRKAVQTPAS